MSIGEILKQARMVSALSQEDVAEKVGVSRQTMSNWENGKSYPDIAGIMALSDIYDVTLDSLLKGDSEMIKHLEESTNAVKGKKQVAASIIALGLFLFGTAFVIVGYGGQIGNFINFPSWLMIFIALVAVLTVTRSFKLFAIGFKTALFPKKEIEEEVRRHAVSLYRLLSKSTAIASVIGFLISTSNMLLYVDYSSPHILNTIGTNIAAALVAILYGLFLILVLFEPVIYMLKRGSKAEQMPNF